MSQRFATDNAGGTEIADGSTGDVAIADNDIILVLDADGNFADTEAAVAGLFDDGTDGGQALQTAGSNESYVVIVRDTTNNETKIFYVASDAANNDSRGRRSYVGRHSEWILNCSLTRISQTSN